MLFSSQRHPVLQIPDYRRYLMGGAFASAGSQMTGVALGWEVYERTNSAFSLGILGFIAALPVIALALPAGTLADRVPRKRICIIAEIGAVLCLLMLALASYFKAPIAVFYCLIGLNATCGAFLGPALGALVTNLVPEELIPDAVKWSSIRWQIASTLGPVLGGFLIFHIGSSWIYAFDALGRGLFCLLLLPMRPRPQQKSKEALSWRSVLGGWHFVKSQPLILSTISLDMFAVLFGGATALLPIYAKDILQVGAPGLGPLRAAPAVGAIVMGLYLTQCPPLKRNGRALLLAIIGFGAATIVFGLSTNFLLSLAALATLGALDSISVFVRHSLLQILTPDAMRGRVNAINSVFIGTSNEIGELESGLAAHYLGPMVAVAGGGALTILVVFAVALLFPQVRRLERLEDLRPAPSVI